MFRRKQRKEKVEQAKRVAFLTLDGLVRQLLAKAEQEDWSQRKLAAKIGITPRTFRRIRAGQVHPSTWLPKIESAVFRLK
jgi:ribosome-binding protein aMBF1 (putative translation factor)